MVVIIPTNGDCQRSDTHPKNRRLIHYPGSARCATLALEVPAPVNEVRIVGASTLHTREATSGHPLHQHFCPTCGTTFCWYRPTNICRKAATAGRRAAKRDGSRVVVSARPGGSTLAMQITNAELRASPR